MWPCTSTGAPPQACPICCTTWRPRDAGLQKCRGWGTQCVNCHADGSSGKLEGHNGPHQGPCSWGTELRAPCPLQLLLSCSEWASISGTEFNTHGFPGTELTISTAHAEERVPNTGAHIASMCSRTTQGHSNRGIVKKKQDRSPWSKIE